MPSATSRLAAPRAECQPHRHLAGSRGTACEKQVGHVGAGDQRHQRGDSQEDGQRPASLAVQHALAASAALDRDRALPEASHCRLAHSQLQRRLYIGDDGPVGGVDSLARLGDRTVRGQSAEQVEPVTAPALHVRFDRIHRGGHGQWRVHDRLHAEGGAVESLRSDADDRECLPVNRDRAADRSLV